MRLKLRNHCENADDYRPLFRLHSLKHRSELGAWVHDLQLRACWLSAKLLVVPRETGEGEVVHPVTVSTRSSRLQRQVCETTASPRPQRFHPASEPQGEKSCEYSSDFIQQTKVYWKFESLQLRLGWEGGEVGLSRFKQAENMKLSPAEETILIYTE